MNEIYTLILFLLIWEEWGKYIFPNILYYFLFWQIFAEVNSNYISTIASFMTLMTFCFPVIGLLSIIRCLVRGDIAKFLLNMFIIIIALLGNILIINIAVLNYNFNIYYVLIYLFLSLGISIFFIINSRKCIRLINISKKYVHEGNISSNRAKYPHIYERVHLGDEFLNKNKFLKESISILCPKCKNPIFKDSNFCTACGFKIQKSETSKG